MDTLRKRIGQQKVLLLYGSRRVGKTYILKQIAKEYGHQCLFLNGEDMDDAERLSRRTVANYQSLLAGKKLLLIDEAQYVPEIGNVLKLIIDHVDGLTVIATGSSSFELIHKTGEPLVGRSYTYYLYPIAQCELQEDKHTALKNLEQRLVFGGYPELWNITGEAEKALYLKELVTGYLLKDIFIFREVRNSAKILQLLKLLAYQIGNEVSLNEMAAQLGISKDTVEHYLDLLTKVFIIFPLSGYGGNLRKEVVKTKKWYFFDNGIRNAIINDFKVVQNRNDTGALWEQYFISERIKRNHYKEALQSYYFWRTYDQQEIDFIEESQNGLLAFECKWNHAQKKIPAAFAKTYPQAAFQIISRESYLNWIV